MKTFEVRRIFVKNIEIISALTRQLSNKRLVKSDTRVNGRYIALLECVSNSGMLKTFIIIYRIISGAELDLAEGPTGHKFHIFNGQINRNINGQRLALSICILYLLYASRLHNTSAMTLANTIIANPNIRCNYHLI